MTLMPTGRLRLEGKVAVITGAGSSGPGLGTGKAASILFAREGARVLLVDRNPQAAEETLATIREEGGEASIIGADVTRAVDCQAIADAAVERYGALHILFNNVGITGPGSPTDVEESVWDNVLDVNLKSMMLTTKYAVPKMMDAGGGSIINMSSIAGVRAGSGAASVPYSASKAGVIGMSETMAVHLGRDNVRVNVIAPGHIYTPMVGGTMEPITRERRRKAGPLGVEGNAWDIAYAALFLASDESRWVSGVVLPVDAGLLAATPLAMYSRISEGE
jgi:NAD(P)-dependent dehydrogenase (short-subunit alcohol dehydrogenase family)